MRKRIKNGSIPAWAGEPGRSTADGARNGVDPRVGGGAIEAAEAAMPITGRSPRGRGSQGLRARFQARRRSIPAWAGEPANAIAMESRAWVDPRVGGGACRRQRHKQTGWGRSPRGRGSPLLVTCPSLPIGSIPAWAGEPAMPYRRRTKCRVDPRVGGGASTGRSARERKRGRSPRGRGSLSLSSNGNRRSGSIPAWAGEPAGADQRESHHGVDPRVGGGAKRGDIQTVEGEGRSPRGRGSQSRRPSATS